MFVHKGVCVYDFIAIEKFHEFSAILTTSYIEINTYTIDFFLLLRPPTSLYVTFFFFKLQSKVKQLEMFLHN